MTSTTRGKEAAAAAATVEATLGARVMGRAMDEGARRTKMTRDVRAYALRRLTRGLSSGRGGARQGFALALSELASSETLGTTPMEALEALDANVAVITKSTKGEEARDILLGRMFGLAAIGIALGARTDLDEGEDEVRRRGDDAGEGVE